MNDQHPSINYLYILKGGNMHIHKTPEYVKYLNTQIYNKHGLVGSVFYSNKCGKFKILEKVKTNRFRIVFLYTNEEYIVSQSNIIPGEIKDYMYPTIYEIACLGRDCKELKRNDPKLYKCLLMRYYDIISRCYNKNDTCYKIYGAKGVKVSNEWLSFSQFYKDIVSLPDFDRKSFIEGSIAIDKDKRQMDIPLQSRVYSKDTISLLTQTENNVYRDYVSMGDKHSTYFVCTHNGISTIEKNMIKFAETHSLNLKHIRNILYKQTKSTDYNFRYLSYDELRKLKSGELQIGSIIDN